MDGPEWNGMDQWKELVELNGMAGCLEWIEWNGMEWNKWTNGHGGFSPDRIGRRVLRFELSSAS